MLWTLCWNTLNTYTNLIPLQTTRRANTFDRNGFLAHRCGYEQCRARENIRGREIWIKRQPQALLSTSILNIQKLGQGMHSLASTLWSGRKAFFTLLKMHENKTKGNKVKQNAIKSNVRLHFSLWTAPVQFCYYRRRCRRRRRRRRHRYRYKATHCHTDIGGIVKTVHDKNRKTQHPTMHHQLCM